MSEAEFTEKVYNMISGQGLALGLEDGDNCIFVMDKAIDEEFKVVVTKIQK